MLKSLTNTFANYKKEFHCKSLSNICKFSSNTDHKEFIVAIDLDECMVHSQILGYGQKNPLHVDYRQADFRPASVNKLNSFECTLPLGETTVVVNKRPFLDHFLQEVSEEFRCISFTASDKLYASEILDNLDPGHYFFAERLYKEHCRHVNGIALKDLSVIRKDLSRIVIIENSPKAIFANPLNAILVPPFFDNPKDNALEEVLDLLYELRDVPDVRPVLQKKFRYDFIYKAEINALFGTNKFKTEREQKILNIEYISNAQS